MEMCKLTKLKQSKTYANFSILLNTFICIFLFELFDCCFFFLILIIMNFVIQILVYRQNYVGVATDAAAVVQLLFDFLVVFVTRYSAVLVFAL